MEADVHEVLTTSQEVLATMDQPEYIRQIDMIGCLLQEAARQRATIFIAGNGGSWADAEHFAAELRAHFDDRNRPALPSISLATLTAWGNDYPQGFETALGRDLEAMARPGDILIGISTSGKAKNVRFAFTRAQALSLTSIAISGNGPESSAFGKLADHHLVIPNATTARIQEAYQVVIHILSGYLDRFEVDP
ncbi:SIS domain-containing protein [Candidatus Berkelbacteria bacterium]|nr:SIS domain-containing protein [Candidatus Berkelbacteria bacterium]